MLYSASTLQGRSIQYHYHSALCITSPLPHLDHTARCALSHTLPHQHSQSPYFHKPYYTINLTLNRIASQYPYGIKQGTTELYHYKTSHNFTVPLLDDT